MKEIKQETNRPKGNLPYQDVNRPFRMQFVIPGPGIKIEQDKNGVLYISAEGGASVSDIVAGDNIEIERREDGAVVISAVNTITDISAGENVTVSIDPDTGSAVISTIIGGDVNEHYKGIFDYTGDLIAKDPEPEEGDYGLVKNVVITNGEAAWTGSYKYCFFFDGSWKLVDQMLTFTKNLNLIYKYFSVGGGSPTIYLHEVAKSGNFWDLNNIPIVATPEVTVEGTTVTATCATEGAEIWYTTDGSMPHVNGTKYTGPITVSEATSFRFVGIKNGMINSLEATASADYDLQAPVIELDWQTGVVTMTNPNVDGQGNPVGNIYYSRDDSPVQLYTEPLQEMAAYGLGVHYVAYVSEGNEQSALTDVVFPRAGIEGYVDSASETGVISYFWSCSGGEVHYTLDGSTPNFNSPMMNERLYTNRYGSVVNFKCCSFRDGYIPRGVRTKTYGYSSPSAPSVSYNSETGLVTLLRAGNVMTSPEIPLKTTPDDPTIGCRIYYTLDGSTPTDQSTLYTGPFQISGNTTVKAVLIAYGQYSSDVSELEIQVMAQPQFSLDWHTGNVSMTNPNGEGTIYYTLDGSEPTSESNVYYAPVTLTNNTTVKAKVIAETGSSATATQTFTRAQAPKINDGNVSLTYNLNILTGIYDVKMNTSQQGGVIRYTSLPGHFPADPTWSDNQFVDELSAPFFEEWTFEARTFAEGFIPSAVVTQTFGLDSVHPVLINYDEDSATVSFHRQWFTAQIPLQTNNNTPELGCRVYYTLDGSTPDDTSTLWDGNPVSVSPGTTVKAVLVCYGQYESEVATYNVPGGGGQYGVRFSKSSDSADGERVGDMSLHASLPIQSGMKRCLLLDNGTVNYYLDPDDSTKKADGTAADLTGEDGQYMVEIPEFYANLIETDDYVEFSVSTDPVDGYFHYPKMYVSADEACLDRATGKLAAVVNNTANYRGGDNDASRDSDPYLTLLQRPVSNISWQDFLSAAQLRGSGWCNYMNLVNSALYFLFITEYATRNTQKAYNPVLTAEGYRQGGLGPDVTEFYEWFIGTVGGEPFIPTGHTASLGNHTGVKDYTLQFDNGGETVTHTAHVSSYRGVSVPIGHLIKAASGYFLRATSDEDVYVYFRNNPDTMSYEPVAGDISVRVPISIKEQLVSKLGFAGGNLYPEEGTGDPISEPTRPLTTHYCDVAHVPGPDMASEIYDPESPNSLVPSLGGHAYGGSPCGFACAYFISDPSAAAPNIGSRLCFITQNV